MTSASLVLVYQERENRVFVMWSGVCTSLTAMLLLTSGQSKSKKDSVKNDRFSDNR